MATRLLCFGALVALTSANPLPPWSPSAGAGDIETGSPSGSQSEKAPFLAELEEIVIRSGSDDEQQQQGATSDEDTPVRLTHYLNSTCPSTAVFEYHFGKLGIRPPSPGKEIEIADTLYSEMKDDIAKMYPSGDDDPELAAAQTDYANELLNQYKGVKYAMDQIQEKFDILGLDPKPEYTDNEEQRHLENDEVRRELIKENTQLKLDTIQYKQRQMDLTVVTGGSFIGAGISYGMLTYSADAMSNMGTAGSVIAPYVVGGMAIVIGILTGVIIGYIQKQQAKMTAARILTLQSTLQAIRNAQKTAQDAAAKTRVSASQGSPFLADAPRQSVAIEMETLLRSSRDFESNLVAQSRDGVPRRRAYPVEDLINLESGPTNCVVPGTVATS